MKKNQKFLTVGTVLLLLFVLWTFLLCFIDVQPIGPNYSKVGFATLNKFIHNLTGVNMALYNITDWLGLVPVFISFSFAILGLVQWIKRKHILKVDYDILMLGVFYIVVFSIYFLFEYVVINHRPVLINGYLEVSYPSSTTMLVLCVIPSAIIQFKARIKQKALQTVINTLLVLFMLFMVFGRLISGVHWFSDIIGGILISSGLVSLYKCSIVFNKNKKAL